MLENKTVKRDKNKVLFFGDYTRRKLNCNLCGTVNILELDEKNMSTGDRGVRFGLNGFKMAKRPAAVKTVSASERNRLWDHKQELKECLYP